MSSKNKVSLYDEALSKGFKRTDDFQYQKQVSPVDYIMIEAIENPITDGFIVSGMYFNIEDYMSDYETIINTYYSSVRNFQKCGDEATRNDLFAEMISELNFNFGSELKAETEYEAEILLLELMNHYDRLLKAEGRSSVYVEEDRHE
ncbi:hypothetical protein M2146_001172 [Lachnospiraceae bacterium PF1-22]